MFYKFFKILMIASMMLSQISCVTLSDYILSPAKSISSRDSFVKLDFFVNDVRLGSASGVIINHISNNTIILTAAHVCEINNTVKMYAVDIDFNKYDSFVVKVDERADLCLIGTKKLIPKKVAKLASHKATPGTKVFTTSAPLGIHGKNMILQFTGFYSGRVLHPKYLWYLDIHTLPTKPGSSGSPVYNSDWEVIGIVSMALGDIENVCMSTTTEDVLRFVNGFI